MKPRILLVDDEASMLELVSGFFREQGYEVRTAQTGKEAMQLADDNAFDLAVLDIHLNDENGLVLLSFFKGRFPNLPVVLFTGLPQDDYLVDQALARGASGFMRKTDSLENLCEAVRTYLPA
jgi:DNA-binding NtrC family response regulator